MLHVRISVIWNMIILGFNIVNHKEPDLYVGFLHNMSSNHFLCQEMHCT